MILLMGHGIIKIKENRRDLMITFKDGKIILEKEDYFCLNCGGLY